MPVKCKKLLVLIDCWNYENSDLQVNIKNNTRTTAYENIVTFFKNNDIDLLINSNYENKSVHPVINSFLNKTPHHTIFDTNELINLIQKNAPAEVYYAGTHWNQCIRNRPTGWEPVQKEIIKHDIDCRIVFDPRILVKESHIDGSEQCPAIFEEGDLKILTQLSDYKWELNRRQNQ